MIETTPYIGQVFESKERYWNWVNTLRSKETTLLPDWSFDFISVHAPIKLRSYITGYSIYSPLILVEIDEERPKFEKEYYKTKEEAMVQAKKIACALNTFVVFCD